MVFVRETVKVDGNVLSLKNRNIRKLTDKKRKKDLESYPTSLSTRPQPGRCRSLEVASSLGTVYRDNAERGIGSCNHPPASV